MLQIFGKPQPHKLVEQVLRHISKRNFKVLDQIFDVIQSSNKEAHGLPHRASGEARRR